MSHFTPEPPQRIMIDHLLRVPRTFNIVGMGIGKSSACLYALNELFDRCETVGALVIAPLRVVNLTWPMEVQQWDQFRWMRVANLRTPLGRRAFLTGSAHLYLINYEALASREITLKKKRPPTEQEKDLLRSGVVPDNYLLTPRKKKAQDGKLSDEDMSMLKRGIVPPGMSFYEEVKKVCKGFIEEFLEGNKAVPFDTIIIDESTKLKSHEHKGGNRLRRWMLGDAKASQRRWALTGTPAPNSLMDLFGQVRLLDDGQRLGKNFELFKRNFFHTTDYMQYNWAPNDGAKAAIEDRIHDITITLRTSDWLKDVPDAVVEDVEITMPKDVEKQYRDFEKDLILQLQKEKTITAANAAVLVGKLLQFTSGACYDENREVHVIHDLKIKALAKIIKETRTPVLVACQYQHEQDRLRKAFPQARFFRDAKSSTSQMALLQAWNERKVPILVAHPNSIGHGLNLQKGSNTMVWMTLSYSRETYEQMIARLARRGQPDVVTVHRLMCPGTADEAVAAVLQEKRDTEQRLLSALMLLESVRESPAAAKKIAHATEKQFANDDEP